MELDEERIDRYLDKLERIRIGNLDKTRDKNLRQDLRNTASITKLLNS
ncbi:MAG: hypothetical protein ACOCSH_01360 [Candidatus Hadarchaeota archaeon]